MYAVNVAPQLVAQSKSEWSSGLCSCMEDFNLCCYGTFCSACQIEREIEARRKLGQVVAPAAIPIHRPMA